MTTEPETVEVEDLDMFVKLLKQWHDSKVKVLEHMLEIPEGTEVDFNGTGSQKLEEKLREGFVIGISLALMELGVLPFVSVSDQQPATSDASAVS
jgi:hypothetical protein